ncbi:hypothetical protein ACS25C_00500 [Dickeya undicola]|uniref:hypothetical protein n=1 Tax=Dickeya undicola TaxID=1577887 RepID=UPI003F266F92
MRDDIPPALEPRNDKWSINARSYLDVELKIAVSGAFVIGGVLLEEYLSKTLGAMFAVLPSWIGHDSGSCADGVRHRPWYCITAYLLDRFDLFGAQHQQDDNAVLAMLQDGRAQADARLLALLGSVPGPA